MKPPAEPPDDKPSASADDFPWPSWFQRCSEPLFLLNRRQRLLFVNRAFEQLTGWPLREVRGWSCKRRHADAQAGSAQAVQHALAPPAEARQGRATQVRRRAPLTGPGARWWDISYVPLAGPATVLGILGTIRVTPHDAAPAAAPLPEKVAALRAQVRHGFRLDQVPSEVPSVQLMIEQARLAGNLRLAVTLVGEAGTGKRWLAHAIHVQTAQESFFAALDCARLSTAVLSDLLSDEGGLRRRHLATLYLREPGRLPRELQARLCAWLQAWHDEPAADRPCLVAGFAGDVRTEVLSGRLLEDLHCRLGTLTIQVPPLRERLADLPWLIDSFSARAAEASERPLRGVSAEAMQILRTHRWPGNLAELYGVLRAACLRAKGEQIEAADLPFHLRATPAPAERKIPLDPLLEQVEARLIRLALRLAHDNKTRAAELLSIWKPRLLRRMEALGIRNQESAREPDIKHEEKPPPGS